MSFAQFNVRGWKWWYLILGLFSYSLSKSGSRNTSPGPIPVPAVARTVFPGVCPHIAGLPEGSTRAEYGPGADCGALHGRLFPDRAVRHPWYTDTTFDWVPACKLGRVLPARESSAYEDSNLRRTVPLSLPNTGSCRLSIETLTRLGSYLAHSHFLFFTFCIQHGYRQLASWVMFSFLIFFCFAHQCL